jgi:prevent-host-death family protein
MATKDDGSEVPSSEARDRFSELLSRAAFGGERIILTRRGKGLAALIPLEDLELIEKVEDQIDLEEARAALDEAAREGTISLADVKRELGL